MQEITVYLILCLSLCYIGYRVYKAIQDSGDPCSGCSGCEMKANRETCKNSGKLHSKVKKKAKE